MSKLFVFGCSYTEGFDTNKISNYREYYDFRGGNFPETWPEVLGRMLNYEVVNYGVGASGNEQIFQSVCDHCSEFTNEDLVIVEWSYLHRYRFVDFKTNQWVPMGPGPNPHVIGSLLSEVTHKEICVNRGHRLYQELVYSYEKIIDRLSKSIGFELYYWSGEGKLIYNLPQTIKSKKKYLLGSTIVGDHTPFNPVFNLKGERIYEETGGKIVDYHLGESGHRIMGELFCEHIINARNSKSIL